MLLKFIMLIFAATLITACTDKSRNSGTGRSHSQAVLKPAEELEDVHIETLKPGSGEAAKYGSQLKVKYQAWVYDPQSPGGKGELFDSSDEKGGSFQFTLGEDQVLPSWETGLIGIKPGEIRKLISPANLAYGSAGAGRKVPPDTAVVFEIELESLHK